MSGLPFGDALTADVMSTVVNETQFGLVSEIRFALAIILAGCLAYDRLLWVRGLALISALRPDRGPRMDRPRLVPPWEKRESTYTPDGRCICTSIFAADVEWEALFR